MEINFNTSKNVEKILKRQMNYWNLKNPLNRKVKKDNMK